MPNGRSDRRCEVLVKCCAPVRRSNCCKGDSDDDDDQFELKAKISKDVKGDSSLSDRDRSDGSVRTGPQSAHKLSGKRDKEVESEGVRRIPALEVALATHVGDGGREEQSSERSFGEDLEIFPPDFNSIKMGQFRGKLRKENQQMRSSFKGGIQEIHDEGARREGAAELEESEVLEDPTLVPLMTVRKSLKTAARSLRSPTSAKTP
mmetsp:Transcript_40426/g.127230  ORF Transcript_40426/g.127230 Transcript_40426/m.127230 type:complete len:206 (+) Transcript_40426:34-651(+)